MLYILKLIRYMKQDTKRTVCQIYTLISNGTLYKQLEEVTSYM